MDKKKILLSRPMLFLTITIILYTATVFLKQSPFLWDAADYWTRGEKLFSSGSLTLGNIDSFRGYIFPLWLGICGKLGGIKAWEIIHSVQIAAFLTWVFPKLFYVDKDREHFFAQGLFVICCLVLFFTGIIVNPLSDFIAIELCLTAQMLLMTITSDKHHTGRVFIKSLCIGIMVYWAYNIRTIYIFGAIFIVFESFWILIKNFHAFSVRYIVVILMGIILSAIPQVMMNYQSQGVVSPIVLTRGLNNLHLFYGLQLQRYDATISSALGTARVCFVDRAGIAILQKEQIVKPITYKQYLHLIVKYPFEMVAIYFRHFINMLMPVFPEGYIANLDNGKMLITIITFVIFVLFGIEMILGCIDQKSWLNFVPIFLPIVFIVPGVVEYRFGMGIYLFVFGAICYRFNLIQGLDFLKAYAMRSVVFVILIAGLVLVIWSSTLASLEIEYPPQIVLDYPLVFR